MIKPNIFIIGVQKSGTTSLYHYLRKHPDIYGPEIKDYNNSHPFFTDENYFVNQKSDFEKLFMDNSDYKNVITSEVDLIEKREYLERIKKYSPNSKIIICLRNPLDRLKSMFKFYTQFGRNPNNYSFHEALQNEPEIYLNRSLYYEKVKDAFDIFGKRNVKVVFFEDLTGEKFSEAIMELWGFIGVVKIKNEFIHENPTGKVKYKLLDKVLRMGQDTRFRDFLVQKIIDRFMDANQRYRIKRRFLSWNLRKGTTIEVMGIPEEIKWMLFEDIKKLSGLLNIDLMKYWQLKI